MTTANDNKLAPGQIRYPPDGQEIRVCYVGETHSFITWTDDDGDKVKFHNKTIQTWPLSRPEELPRGVKRIGHQLVFTDDYTDQVTIFAGDTFGYPQIYVRTDMNSHFSGPGDSVSIPLSTLREMLHILENEISGENQDD